MRNLIWKDYRQNRAVLLAVLIVAAAPYLVVLVVATLDRLFWGSDAEVWMGAAGIGSWASLWLSVMLAAFLGGNAIAGERADRSAEFAAGLPIPRTRAIISKAAIAALPGLALWAVNSLVLISVVKAFHGGRLRWFLASEASWAAVWALLLGVLLFGLAWLFSSLFRSPALATASSLGTVTALAVATLSLKDSVVAGRSPDFFAITVLALCVGIGLLAFITGVLVSLQRREP